MNGKQPVIPAPRSAETLENEIWGLFKELEAGPDEQEQARIREKIWQHVVENGELLT